MVNHSLRTYRFSRLIGMGMGLSFDDEALYVASLTHDLGFYGRYAIATAGADPDVAVEPEGPGLMSPMDPAKRFMPVSGR
jgi:hypothetical protein